MGTPQIHIYDDSAHPRGSVRKLNHFVYGPGNGQKDWGQPSEFFLNKFFGFIECDITPPNDLYHPVLVFYDEKRKKSIASLEPIKRQVFTSVEFQTALKHGYKVDKVYRIDEYNKKPSLWRDMMKQLAILKISFSGVPHGVDEEEYRQAYRDRFDMELLPEITSSPARKSTYKVPLNAAWGKCAETLEHMESEIHQADDYQSTKGYFDRLNKGHFTTTNTTYLSEDLVIRDYKLDRNVVDADYASGYLPAAVFVPAYGRLALWSELHKLGDRVLMHDTDSIVYHSKHGAYDTDLGHLLGGEGLATRTILVTKLILY